MDAQDFARQVLSGIQSGTDILAATRQQLRVLLPGEVLSVVYRGKRDTALKGLSFVLDAIRDAHPRRQSLLRWVYEDDRISKQVSYVRLPSISKRLLVAELSRLAARRYPWINSRLLHAWAFRQRLFELQPSRTWGPIYSVRRLATSGGKERLLEIPFPPLHRVQRLILRHVLHHAENELPGSVFGFRRTPNWTIAKLAEKHVGQAFVACYDLKNFFPSVRLRHIIPALANIKGPLLRLESTDQDGHAKIKDIAWTQDAALLVAKLVTRRGHLPQGAPTSPAVANLAFAPYDERICELLGPHFVYTRYADDLMVSISRRTGSRRGFTNASQLRRYAAKQITLALQGSGFKLNSRKTRAGSVSEGVDMVGLQITSKGISLPRRKKRELRAMEHGLRTLGLVKLAERQVPTERVINVTPVTKTREHRAAGRRLSYERLAVLMTREICPDLRVSDTRERSLAHRMAEVTGPLDLSGKLKWRYLEQVLYYLWAGRLKAEAQNGRFLLRDQGDGTAVCTVEGENFQEFLCLSPRLAMQTVDFWHRTRGYAAFLNGVAQSFYAAELKKGVTALRDLLLQPIKVPPTTEKASPRPLPSGGPLVLTPMEKAAELLRVRVHEFLSLLRDFRSYSGQLQPSIRESQFIGDLTTVALSVEQMGKWMIACRTVVVDGLERIPEFQPIPGAPRSTILDVIRILDDRLAGRRIKGYIIEDKLNVPIDISGAERGARELYNVQTVIIDHLFRGFEQDQKKRRQLGTEEWVTRLANYEWRGDSDCGRRLTYAAERIRDSVVEGMEAPQGHRLLLDAADGELQSGWEHFARPIEAQSSEGAWRGLFLTGYHLWKTLIEVLAQPKHDWKVVRERCTPNPVRRSLRPIYLLRNFGAHVPTPNEERRTEWYDIQSYVASKIGRAWKKPKEPPLGSVFGPNDLELTALEASEARLRILQDMCLVWGLYRDSMRSSHEVD